MRRRQRTYANVAATAALLRGRPSPRAAGSGSADIRDNAVASRDLKNGDVRGVDLRAGAVTTAKLADGAVTAAKLAAGSVTRTALANGAVDGTRIADGSVGAADLAEDALPVRTTPFSLEVAAGTMDGPTLDFGSLHAQFGCAVPGDITIVPVVTWTTDVDGAVYLRTSVPNNVYLLRSFSRGQSDLVNFSGNNVTMYIAGAAHVRVEWSLFETAGQSCRLTGVATTWTA